MVKNLWTLLCERTIREEGTGKTTIVSTLDNAEFKKFPVQLPSFILCSRWYSETGGEQAVIRFRHVSPDGKTTDIGDSEHVEVSAGILQIDFTIVGYQVQEPGTHEFRVDIETESGSQQGHPSFLFLKQESSGKK